VTVIFPALHACKRHCMHEYKRNDASHGLAQDFIGSEE